MNQNPLDEYVSGLLKEKQIPDTMENHAKLIEEVNNFIDISLANSLPDSELDALNIASDEGTISDRMIESTLEKSGIDIDAVIDRARADFKEKYMKGGRNE